MPVSASGFTSGTLVDWTDASGSKYDGPPRSGTTWVGNANGGGNFGFDGSGIGWYCYESAGVSTPNGRWQRIPDGSLGGGGATTYDQNAGADAGQTFRLFGGARKEQVFSFTSAGMTTPIDCSNFRSVSVQINTQGTGSGVTFQFSNDGASWYNLPLTSANNTVFSTTQGVGSTGIWAGAIQARFFRLNITGITAGTTAGLVEYTTLPFSQSLPSPNFASPNADAIGAGTGSVQLVENFNLGFNGTSWDRLQSGSTNADNVGASTGVQRSNAFGYVFNGSGFDRQRAANVFKFAQSLPSATPSYVTIWTPTTGKKFRLLKYMLAVTGDAYITGGAQVNLTLVDGGANIVSHRHFMTNAATNNDWQTPWIDLGNGYLSTLANNNLQLFVSTGFTGGQVSIIAIGNEE